jgi:hypothetical protein
MLENSVKIRKSYHSSEFSHSLDPFRRGRARGSNRCSRLETVLAVRPSARPRVLFLAGKAAEHPVAFGDKFLVRGTAVRIARVLRFQPVEEEHFELAVMLGLDGAPRLQFE